MIYVLKVGRKINGQYVDEPFTHTISGNWQWLLRLKVARLITKIVLMATDIYLPHGKEFVTGRVREDDDRPNFSEVEVLLDGRYAFSIEQDALV